MNHMTNSTISTAADDAALVTAWLQRFEAALKSADTGRLAALFAPESHWRDLLAFTWNITPHEGAADIAAALAKAASATGAHGFALAEGRRLSARAAGLAQQLVDEFLDHSNRFNMRQPRSWAMAWSRASGLVATGSCTFSSSGMSFMESL